MSEVLDAEKAPNTHPVLEEYAVHFDKLNANFCNELKANNEASWKKVTKPEWFHPDDVYEVSISSHMTFAATHKLDARVRCMVKLQAALGIDFALQILMCHRNVLQSYLDSHPPELQKLQEASLADLRWLIDNSERLHSASEKDFKNIE